MGLFQLLENHTQERRNVNIIIICLSAIIGLAVYAFPVSADLLLTEDWEAETVGDGIDQLEQWNAMSGRGEIMLQDGNQFLRLDHPSNLSWITSKAVFSFAAGNELSLASDITLRGAADIDAPAKLGIRRDLSPYPRYNVAVYPDRVTLEELGGETAILGSLAASVEVNRQHAFLLTVKHRGDSIDFDVYMDGGFLFAATDATPYLAINDRFVAQLANFTPMLADFDNIQLTQVPEPSALLLVLVGGACVFVGLTRCGGRWSPQAKKET